LFFPLKKKENSPKIFSSRTGGLLLESGDQTLMAVKTTINIIKRALGLVVFQFMAVALMAFLIFSSPKCFYS